MTRKESKLIIGGGISYVAPVVETLDITVEGVLCGSGTTGQKFSYGTIDNATESNWGTL